jgi:hypothetical protein
MHKTGTAAMNIAETRRLLAPPVPAFNPVHYPKSYETRMESYPLRRRVGLFLIILGGIYFAIGVLQQHEPVYIAGGGALVVVSFWLARARLSTIVLHADRIEITQGQDHELRLRANLLGWKYAQESDLRHPKGSGQKWVLLASVDDDVPPLMLEITRPELDKDFMAWVFSLRNLHQPLDMREPVEAPPEQPPGS